MPLLKETSARGWHDQTVQKDIDAINYDSVCNKYTSAEVIQLCEEFFADYLDRYTFVVFYDSDESAWAVMLTTERLDL